MFETLTIKSKVAITLDANTGTSVKPLLVNTPYVKSGYRVISEYLDIENLKAVSWIYSLAEVLFPVFEFEDTESKQLLAAINLEWKSPRIQMDVVVTVNDGTNWQRISAYSLLNANPYPYREYSLGNHTLGDNAMIGLQIKNVGFGSLQNGNLGSDRVTVFADLVRVVTIEKLVDNSQKIVNSISSIASVIVNSNVNRRGITFFNSSNITVFIDTVSSLSPSSFLVNLKAGDYWEPPTQNYTGNYYAVTASGNTAIDVREFV